MNKESISLAILGIVAVLAVVGLILLFAGQISGASQFSLPMKTSVTQAKTAEKLQGNFDFCRQFPLDPKCQYTSER